MQKIKKETIFSGSKYKMKTFLVNLCWILNGVMVCIQNWNENEINKEKTKKENNNVLSNKRKNVCQFHYKNVCAVAGNQMIWWRGSKTNETLNENKKKKI